MGTVAVLACKCKWLPPGAHTIRCVQFIPYLAVMDEDMFAMSRDGYKDTKGSDVDNSPGSTEQQEWC
jgi:hypothetical protein